MLGVVVSRADIASVTIGEALRSHGEWTPFHDATNPSGWGDTGYRRDDITIREFDDLHLDLDAVATAFDDPALVVFASRHSGETGPLLSTHFTGNFGSAEFGGEDYAVAEPAPNAARQLLHRLREVAPSPYDVTFECTHHGPTTVGAPSLFVEIGSSTNEWEDERAARAAADAVIDLVDTPAHTDRTLTLVGDSHYAPRGTRIVEDTDWAVGHIVPDWALEDLRTADPQLIDAAFTTANADHAVLTDVPEDIAATVDAAGYRIVTETWVRETSGVPLDTVTAIETDLGAVDDGVRFGDYAATTDEFIVDTLPTAVLEAALGIDQDRTLDAVTTTTTAYTTTDGGTRVTARVAVPADAGVDAVIDSLLPILETGYDTVTRTEDTITVTETVFDPDLATEHGVPEGPKFGELAAGNPVTIDGKTIDPDAVRTRRTRRFPL